MMHFIDLVLISICTQNAASKIGQRQFEYSIREVEINDEQINEHFQQFIINYQQAYEVNGQKRQESYDISGDIFAHVITHIHTTYMYVYY